jgi:hypothetical protein
MASTRADGRGAGEAGRRIAAGADRIGAGMPAADVDAGRGLQAYEAAEVARLGGAEDLDAEFACGALHALDLIGFDQRRVGDHLISA